MSAVAAVFAALYAAHMVGDHWIQTDAQAQAKAGPGWPGRLADARHVATLTVTKVVFLAALAGVTRWHPSILAVTAGLAVDAVSHWWIDRRHTLVAVARFAERLGSNGKTRFLNLGTPRPGRDDAPHLGTGAYALDQAWHIGWLYLTALIIGGLS